MIKISSFFPFAGLRRVTQEFGEEKAFVKMKSLTSEQELEFEYKDVDEISNVLYVDKGQNDFGFGLLCFTTITLSLLLGMLGHLAASYPVLLRIEQILYVCGLILYITSFKKKQLIHISDKNNNILTYIKLTPKNRDLMRQAIDKIKDKSKGAQEFTTIAPSPKEQPAFEHIYYDLPYLEKTTDRVYENQIIGFQTGVFNQRVYSVKYSQLSGKVYRKKSDSGIWGLVFYTFTLLISLIIGFFLSFRIPLPMNLVYVVLALVGLLFVLLPLKFIKRETIGLYDKNGNIAYWTYVSKANKEKVEKIVEFIQSKISSTNEELLKEQA